MAKHAEEVFDVNSELPGQVKREPGFLYFIDASGKTMRSPLANKPLSPEVKAQREKAKAEKKAATKKKRDASIAAKIAALQAKL